NLDLPAAERQRHPAGASMTQRLAASVVLRRLVDYLELAGIELTDTLLLELMEIVRGGIERNEGDLFGSSLAQLNGRVRNAALQVQASAPTLCRASIGYGVER